jgi:hypothetical protein
MCFPHARRTEEDVILLVPRLIPDSPFSDGWLKPKVELIQGLVKGQIGQFFSVVVKHLGNARPSELAERVFKTFLQPDHWSFTASSRNYRHPGNFQMQVDPVKQRAGQFRAILLDLLRRAGAIALVAGAVEAAGTSVKITP